MRKQILGAILAMLLISAGAVNAAAAAEADPDPAQEGIPAAAVSAAEEPGAGILAVSSGTCGDLTWKLDGGVLTIEGSGSTGDYNADTAPWFSVRDQIGSVVLGPKVTRLGNYLFSGCENLETLTVSDALTGIGYGTFDGAPLKTVKVPSTVTSIPEGIYNISTLTAFVCDPSVYVGDEGYTASGGVLYFDDTYNGTRTLVKCPAAKNVGSYTVLDAEE